MSRLVAHSYRIDMVNFFGRKRIEADVAGMPELRNVLILRALERQYYKLAANLGNPALSLQVIEHLGSTLRRSPRRLGTTVRRALRGQTDRLMHRLR